MKLGFILVFLLLPCGCAMIARTHLCDDGLALDSGFQWSASQKIAIKLTDEAGEPYGEGPGHLAEFWDSPFGRVAATFGVHHPSDWATDIVELCDVDIQGFEASIIAYRKWGREHEIGLWMAETPHGGSILVSMPFQQGTHQRAQSISVLKSLTFINDPKQLRIVDVGSDDVGIFAVVANEIGAVRVVRVNDSVTWNHGIAVEITKTGIVIREYDDQSKSWVESFLQVGLADE